MIKRSLWILATAAFLTACSSGVKLNDIPVEDKNASAASSPAADTNAAPSPVPTAAQSSVATVVGGKAGSQGVAPAGVNVVYFDYDSDAVKAEYRPLIEAHAKYLLANRNAKVIVQGNTDERGSREYNLSLGQRRSVAVKKSLNLLGVQDGQIETVSFGEEKATAGCADESCAKQNRRADIVYENE